MAFFDSQDSNQPGSGSGVTSNPDLVGKVVDVTIDPNNPMLSSITVEAEPSDNLGHYQGQYVIRLDDSKNIAQRLGFANKAKEKGGAFCGALINEGAVRMKGRKLHFEGVKVVGENELTSSWMKSYRHDRMRRPGIVHTTEEPIRGANNEDTGRKAAKIFAISVVDPEAFNVNDEQRLNVLAQRADDNFKRATTPSDTMFKDLNVLRSSMPISEATFAVLDNDSGMVIEHSPIFSKKTPASSRSPEYPEHYTDAERVNSYTGKPVKLPREGRDFKRLAEEFKTYVEDRYRGRNVTPLCIESTMLMASTKVQDIPDMYFPVDVAQGKYASPLQQLHQANKTEFLADPDHNNLRSRGVFHPDIRIQFAPNVGSTYSRYVRVDFNHVPDEYLNRSWLASCQYNGSPLKLLPAINTPVANAMPIRESQAPQQTMAPANAAGQSPASASPQEQQPHQQAPAQSANNLPADDAFNPADALDQEALEHNAQMKEYENTGSPTKATHEKAAVENAPAPVPQTQGVMDTSHLAYSSDQCPFDDDMDTDFGPTP